MLTNEVNMIVENLQVPLGTIPVGDCFSGDPSVGADLCLVTNGVPVTAGNVVYTILATGNVQGQEQAPDTLVYHIPAKVVGV